ncbi:hypothetical protein PoB_003061700 [Plakobranchus ocellatus]|uniref:Thiol oxidase n=1 Tax=Plakobranchus ocellatus TaxID=259542 RepID=A0AAV4AAU0_9GAST|nr:hypothetical protein PoB_003061700 [Plakobranchus ocellatus]
MHNAFQAGHQASSWDLGHFFAALVWIFKDSPARREDFIELTGSAVFACEHCPHRWVENNEVAGQAVEICPAVQTFL